MKFKVLSAAVAALLSPYTFAETTDIDLPAMVVNADFRPSLAQETPISLTTFDSELIESRGAQHVEDILNLAPNVNASSGASRGQYFQIRGMGARSQFTAPLNPSVGLVIDGIDFSRTGGAATLFDIEQVEILRGPQGTRFGTNSLAGVINMKSKQPTDELNIHLETGIAEYNTRNLGIAVGGPLIENKLLGRASVYTNKSDGYMDNHFLNTDDTQNHDEITARGHLKWLVNNDLAIDLNLLHLNIDNGYDAFTFDNSRNSLTDKPGEDSIHTNAFSLNSDWRINDIIQLQSSITYAKSDVVYSYDADWVNPAISDGYNATESFSRDRENYSFELRALSNENGRIFNNASDWLIGFYYFEQNEDLDLVSDFGDLINEYKTENTSIFGQLDTHLNSKLTLISGLRVEYFTADYSDSNAIDTGTNEVLFGGKVGLNYQYDENQLLYTSLARGYKSGGINNLDSLPESRRTFDTEYNLSLEAGLKSSWLDESLTTNVSVFYTLRKDAQVQSAIEVGAGDYEISTANAAKGKNIGIEADVDWLVNQQWRLFAAVGLLRATFDEYDNPDPDSVALSGRRQAHAPNYQFTLGTEIYLTPNWTFRTNIEGKDEFFYSNSHNVKSDSYTLVNSSIDYRNGDWKVTLWGKNLFDKEYATRGFFWANKAPWDEPHKYTQLGDPRVVGINVSWDY